MSISKSFILILLLCVFVNSSLIYENLPDSLFLEKYKIEMKEVQAYNSISKIDMGIFNYTNQTSISLKDIKQEFNYLEVNKLNFSYDVDSFMLSGPKGVFQLIYSFSFNTSEGKSNSGIFSLYSDIFSISKTYSLDKESVVQAKAVVNNLTFLIEDFSFPSQEDESLKILVSSSLNSLVTNHANDFIAAFNKDLGSYYTSITANKSYVTFNSKDPQLKFKLDLTFDRLPQRLYNNSVIFYRDGNINAHVNKHKEISLSKNDAYQIFISKQVLIDFFSDITDDNLLDFTITQKNKPLNTPFNLDVQSLGIIIPELYNLYSRSDEVKVWNVISNVQLNDPQNGLVGRFSILSEIYHSSEMKKIISFKTTFAFTLKFEINNADKKLNFYLDNNSIDVLTINVDDSVAYSHINLTTLKRWVEFALKNQLQNNSYFLLETPFDLTANFRDIIEAYATPDGLAIVGYPKGFYSKLNEIKSQTVENNNPKDQENVKFLYKI